MARLAQALATILLLVVAALAIWLSGRYGWQADWTYANRNSLTEPSRRLLSSLPGEIAFTAYAYPGTAREPIRAAVARYRRADADVTLTFLDPTTHPDELRSQGVEHVGELRVRYAGRSQTLAGLSEQQISSALQRLAVAGDQRVVFLSGHGERDPRQHNPGGYSTLAAELERQGITVETSPQIPNEATVLVIASPQQAYLSGEIQLIHAYLADGGSLLWLNDPSTGVKIAALAALLGFAWQAGTVLYPDYKTLGTGHPAMALMTDYPPHPITRHLRYLTLLPYAGGLTHIPPQTSSAPATWQEQPFLASPARTWLETAPLDSGRIAYEPESGDILGPITLGMTFQRAVPAPARGEDPESQRQRAVVVSDSDFLTNANIDTLGNRQLGAAIFQWLTYRDAQIAITIPPAPDSTLHLAPWQGRGIWVGFVVLLPAILLMIGVARWWLRRRR